MPMYDYICAHCGEEFEELRSLAERHAAPCPRCGSEAQKVLSGFFTRGGSNSGDFPRGGGCSIGGAGGGFRGG
jgi:putative FmdB family regulatory protein